MACHKVREAKLWEISRTDTGTWLAAGSLGEMSVCHVTWGLTEAFLCLFTTFASHLSSQEVLTTVLQGTLDWEMRKVTSHAVWWCRIQVSRHYFGSVTMTKTKRWYAPAFTYCLQLVYCFQFLSVISFWNLATSNKQAPASLGNFHIWKARSIWQIKSKTLSTCKSSSMVLYG